MKHDEPTPLPDNFREELEQPNPVGMMFWLSALMLGIYAAIAYLYQQWR